MEHNNGTRPGAQPDGLRRRASDSARVGPLRRFVFECLVAAAVLPLLVGWLATQSGLWHANALVHDEWLARTPPPAWNGVVVIALDEPCPPHLTHCAALPMRRQELQRLLAAHAPRAVLLDTQFLPDIAALPRTRLRYVPPDPKLVDLSFAGRLADTHPSHAAIAAARPGDPVQLIRDGDRWQIDNAAGQTLARLSRAFTSPDGTTFLRGEVAAILNWRREDGDEDFNHLLRRDAWEVVLPELVFAAGLEAVWAGQKDS